MAVTPEVTDQIPPIEIARTYIQTFNYAPGGVTADISGWTGKYVIRTSDKVGSSAILTLNSAPKFVLGATNPNITITLTDTDTGALSEARGYAWLTLINEDGQPITYIEGPQTIRYAGG